MKNGLNEINKSVGVWGSFLANNRGEVLLRAAPPQLKGSDLENIAQQVLELVNTPNDQLGEISEVVFHYSQRVILFVDLGKAILTVVCTPSVDLPLLRMTVNVVRNDWSEDDKVQRYLDKNFVERV